MLRKCTHCGEPFMARDLCKDVSKELEAQRVAAGVDGVLVRVYTCGHCQKDDVFVDVCALPGESAEAVDKRKQELEDLVQQLPKSEADIVLVKRPMHGSPPG